jgi:hypothetical protein
MGPNLSACYLPQHPKCHNPTHWIPWWSNGHVHFSTNTSANPPHPLPACPSFLLYLKHLNFGEQTQDFWVTWKFLHTFRASQLQFFLTIQPSYNFLRQKILCAHTSVLLSHFLFDHTNRSITLFLSLPHFGIEDHRFTGKNGILSRFTQWQWFTRI